MQVNRGTEAVGFNYDVVAPAHREAVQEDARQIRKRLIETACSMMDIGMRLHRSRHLLPHGAWLPWLTSETGMSEQWARNCLSLHLRFGERPALVEELDVALAPTAIVRLATAPDAAYEAILDRIWAGEKLRVADVEETIRKCRQVQREINNGGTDARVSEKSDPTAAANALRMMANRAIDELVPSVVERMQKLLDVLESALGRIRAGKRVSVKELQGLADQAQWLSDALEQLTQCRASSIAKLVHHTFLERRDYDPGPWAEAAAFLRDISSSDSCSATIRQMGTDAFLDHGAKVLRDVLSPRPRAPAFPKSGARVERLPARDQVGAVTAVGR